MRQDIDTLEHFDLLALGGGSARGWQIGAVDLTARRAELEALDLAGALFLGSALPEGFADTARSRGALVFPALEDVPFEPYRSEPYTPEEIYGALILSPEARYEDTLDGQIYQWYCEHSRAGSGDSPAATLSMAIHDHGMGEALADLKHSADWVGVMGGHAASRGSAEYAQAARLGLLLAEAGYGVATGGGPGAMEAANAGAYFQPFGSAVLDEALERLASVPSFMPSVNAWARVALDLRQGTGLDADVSPASAGRSLGIPTWFYGHEPPNAFAADICKYFANAQREAILLEICSGGIVFLPGAAGTVQEVFQDACENYYAGSADAVNPMVLVGREYWTTTLPVWPLLSALAKGRSMEDRIFLVDTVEDAVSVLTSHQAPGV